MLLAMLVLLTLGGLVVLLAGFDKVKTGAVGIVLFLDRRTSDVRPEGLTWRLPLVTKLVMIYQRERQVDIPKAPYYTADRVRLAFKTTLRVAVTNAVALLEQGPGTYEPFTRDARGDDKAGGEEANISLRSLVENSIRETVQSMRIDEVLFGGGSASQETLGERIRRGLGRTAERWGLSVLEVWLTDVDTEDPKVKQAVQSEVREKMEGKGRLAAWEAQVQKGALFQDVALQMVERTRRELGREIPIEQARSFLLAFYQNDAALEVAMRAASGPNDLMRLFYLQQMGAPVPSAGVLGAGVPARPAELPGAAPASGGPRDGSYVLGREGDIVVDGDGVSRHHARLLVEGGRLTLTDLGSTNGTFLCGKRLAPQVGAPVGDRDTVGLGKTLVVTADQLAEATRTHALRPSAPTRTS